MLTHSDTRKGTLPNFESFDSQNWVGDKDPLELLFNHILCGDFLDTSIRTIRTNDFTFTFCESESRKRNGKVKVKARTGSSLHLCEDDR